MSIQFKHTTLPNGLTIVAEINPDAHTAAVGYLVKTGARDETPADMGVSHFLEHMMFKGTQRRTADDVNREFDEMGANYNAYTSHEVTFYFAHILPEYLAPSIDLLGDIMRPSLRDEEFNMEKNVIIEEIGMYDDRPHWRLQDQLLEDFFGSHTLGFRVLGTPQTITDMTASQMRAYFAERYSPDNIIVAATGKIDWNQLVEEVEKISGHWAPSATKRQYITPNFTASARTVADDRTNRHYIGLMAPGPSAQDNDRYAAKVLADYLGDTEGSRIYWSLIDPGLADEADMAFLGYDQIGSFYAYASCDPDKGEQVESILIDVLNHAIDEIDPSEIERAKNKLATLATLQGERPLGRMQAIAAQWAYQGEYLTLSDELARFATIDRDDVQRVFNQYRFSPQTILRLTPAESS
ncbi:Protease 3 precursor [Poriferisphaera corsica]|uniref:Protease 3 n=1 Tax=Poriferisphaera corsica TaxID=2528020 RepID=A0A517YQ06_9BACT|nr:pitrilysin family protein [Poriferisphaera corsica]QDU32308.1 Protease 3 precursor [Poriferisphaera corsica]